MLHAYEEVVARKDVDSISKFVDESFAQTYPRGKVADKSEHVDALRSMNAKVESMEDRLAFAVHPSFAVFQVRTPGGISLNGIGHSIDVRATQVWRNISNGWSCVAIHSGFIEQA